MLNLQESTYAPWGKSLELTNGVVTMKILIEVGPRIIAFGYNGGQNFFCNFKDEMPQVREDGRKWFNRGGHRLWYGPEAWDLTYYPDNDPVPYDWNGKVLTLLCPDEDTAGIRKRIKIELEDNSAKVKVTHTLTNIGDQARTLTAWSITVMAPGGTLSVPQEPFSAHGAVAANGVRDFLPARPLVLWPYTQMEDPRIHWGNQEITVHQDDSYSTKTKFGVLNKQGVVRYELNGETFTKRHDYIPDGNYSDYHCNEEFFTMPGMLEMETISPLVKLEIGETVTHVEQWELTR